MSTRALRSRYLHHTSNVLLRTINLKMVGTRLANRAIATEDTGVQKVLQHLDVRYGDGLEKESVKKGLDLLLNMDYAEIQTRELITQVLPLVMMHLLSPKDSSSRLDIQELGIRFLFDICVISYEMRTVLFNEELLPHLFWATRYSQLAPKSFDLITTLFKANDSKLFRLEKIRKLDDLMDSLNKANFFHYFCRAMFTCLHHIGEQGVVPDTELHRINEENHVRMFGRSLPEPNVVHFFFC